jgi:hypothetical protein
VLSEFFTGDYVVIVDDMAIMAFAHRGLENLEVLLADLKG